MDDALVPSSSNMRNAGEVLILVVMDDALVLSPKGLTGLIWTGLNPCCNG